MKKIGITLGDFNGISPEILIKALNTLNLPCEKIVIFANSEIFKIYENKFNLKLQNKYEIEEIYFDKKDFNPGSENAGSGEFAFQCVKKACEFANSDKINFIVTAPFSKNALALAGHNFSGHTEILEKYLAKNGQTAEMLFVADNFRVFLLTRHVALKDIPKILTQDFIEQKIKILNNSLIKDFRINNPKLALCALNPHAGENGLFGTEEINNYSVVKNLRTDGIDITDPLPADALFAKTAAEIKVNKNPSFDCYIASYHDQGLIPIKMLYPENSVNMTIGLDILRTSPAHGTAFDIAGKIIANPSGMISALNCAFKSL